VSVTLLAVALIVLAGLLARRRARRRSTLTTSAPSGNDGDVHN
jgi:hypothetical protein